MKKFFLVLIFCFLNNLIFTQSTSLKVSESLEFKDEEKAINILAIHTNKKIKQVFYDKVKKFHV